MSYFLTRFQWSAFRRGGWERLLWASLLVTVVLMAPAVLAAGDVVNPLQVLWDDGLKQIFGKSSPLWKILLAVEGATAVIGFTKSKNPMVFAGIIVTGIFITLLIPYYIGS